MTWNYRVVHRVWGREADGTVTEDYSIHEVYYNEAHEVIAFSARAMPVTQDSMDELRWQLDELLLAAARPVLEYDTLPGVRVRHRRRTRSA